MLENINFQITQEHIDAAPAVHTYTDNPIYNALTEQTDLNILHVSHANIRIESGNFRLSPALTNMRRNPSLYKPCTIQITAIADHTRKITGNNTIPTCGHVDILKWK